MPRPRRPTPEWLQNLRRGVPQQNINYIYSPQWEWHGTKLDITTFVQHYIHNRDSCEHVKFRLNRPPPIWIRYGWYKSSTNFRAFPVFAGKDEIVIGDLHEPIENIPPVPEETYRFVKIRNLKRADAPGIDYRQFPGYEDQETLLDALDRVCENYRWRLEPIERIRVVDDVTYDLGENNPEIVGGVFYEIVGWFSLDRREFYPMIRMVKTKSIGLIVEELRNPPLPIQGQQVPIQEQPERMDQDQPGPIREQPERMDQDQPGPIREQPERINQNQPGPIQEQPERMDQDQPGPIREQPERINQNQPGPIQEQPERMDQDQPDPIQELPQMMDQLQLDFDQHQPNPYRNPVESPAESLPPRTPEPWDIEPRALDLDPHHQIHLQVGLGEQLRCGILQLADENVLDPLWYFQPNWQWHLTDPNEIKASEYGYPVPLERPIPTAVAPNNLYRWRFIAWLFYNNPQGYREVFPVYRSEPDIYIGDLSMEDATKLMKYRFENRGRHDMGRLREMARLNEHGDGDEHMDLTLSDASGIPFPNRSLPAEYEIFSRVASSRQVNIERLQRDPNCRLEYIQGARILRQDEPRPGFAPNCEVNRFFHRFTFFSWYARHTNPSELYPLIRPRIQHVIGWIDRGCPMVSRPRF